MLLAVLPVTTSFSGWIDPGNPLTDTALGCAFTVTGELIV